MPKVLTINNCESCPHFDNSYYEYAQRCTELDRHIDSGERYSFPIPDDCPLPNAETKEGT